MAEDSVFWTTSGTGDGAAGGYTMAEFEQFMRKVFLSDLTTEGVLNIDNGLAVTAGAGARELSVATGAAIVAGRFYWNTAAVTKTLTHPTIGTTGWRLVLRAGWVAQTVRITLLQSADGVAAIPAAVQTDGTTWDISLATGTITTGDVVAITDVRVSCHFNGKIKAGMFEALAIATADIGAAQVTQAKLGTDTLQEYRLKVNWQGANNTTSYAPATFTGTESTDDEVWINKDRLPAGCTVKVRAKCNLDSGPGTGYFRLYNVTTGAAVAGSETTYTNFATWDWKTSANIYAGLAAGNNNYCIQRKSYSAGVWARAVNSEIVIEW